MRNGYDWACRLARGDNSARKPAVKAFWRWLLERVRTQDKNPWPLWALYMSDVDSVCPDMVRRKRYREQLLEQDKHERQTDVNKTFDLTRAVTVW